VAENALNAEYAIRGSSSLEQRAVFVSNILGNADDVSHKDRPFLWQSTNNKMIITDGSEPWPGEKRVSKLITQICQQLRIFTDMKHLYQGLFLGRMVVKTLAEHLVLTSSVSFGETRLYEVSKKPRGALMLCIQAVSSPEMLIIMICFDSMPSTGPSGSAVFSNGKIPKGNFRRQIGVIMSFSRHPQKIKRSC
jgi:hypothetical protein